MRNYIEKIVLMILVVTAIGAQAMADINMPFPSNPAELQGAFSGSQNIGGKKKPVEVLIYGTSMAGSFIVTLIRDSKEAQVFYAEILEEKMIGLISLGLSDDKGDVDDKMPPAALMKMIVNGRNRIESIEMTSQGDQSLLEGSVRLDEVSRNYQISNVVSQGEYGDLGFFERTNKLRVYKADDEALVSGSVSSIGISNDYLLNFDLTGVGVLRAQGYAEHFQKRETQKITAFLLPVKIGDRAGVILIKASDSGSSSPSVVLKLK